MGAGSTPTRTIAALTPGVNVPSARLRVRQLIPALADHGIRLTEFTSRLGAYPRGARWTRPAWVTASIAANLPAVARSHRYDVTLLQREMISTRATLERWTGRPRVFDVDDSIHLHRDGRAARRIAEGSDVVVCGNRHLARVYAAWNDRVEVLPTAVDVDHYRAGSRPEGRQASICWVGTSSNAPYLEGIEPALEGVFRAHPGAVLDVVSDRPPRLKALPPGRVRFHEWDPETERDVLANASVGIMPLPDSEWARGKCSYKMLASMASGLPVVVSPVGMNVDVLEQAPVGLGASTLEEWSEGLLRLLDSPEDAQRMGHAGRDLATSHYSVRVVAARLATILHDV